MWGIKVLTACLTCCTFTSSFGMGLSLSNVESPFPRAPCSILLDSSSSWPSNPPILTDVNDNPVFPTGSYQADDRVIQVQEGAILRLSCSGTRFSDGLLSGDEYAVARCIGGSQFDLSTESNPSVGPFDFRDLGCQVQPDSTSAEIGGSCGPNALGKEIELGFATKDELLEESIIVCFDEGQSRTFYSHHKLYKEILARDTGNDRPDFDPDIYFPFDVDNAYSSSTELQTITELVGSASLAQQYIRPGENYFMSRGHMAPNADFVYYSWQDSTFFFINVAPQWQVFNGGNWNILENAVRNFVEDRQVTLDIYTGTHGVMKLKDVNNNLVEIWLHPEDNRLPAPEYYWKVLYDSDAKTGVAFIGVNNPHIGTSEIENFKICTPLPSHPIMDSISKPNDIKNGVTFACTVDDLRAQFEEVPDFEVVGLLT